MLLLLSLIVVLSISTSHIALANTGKSSYRKGGVGGGMAIQMVVAAVALAIR
jgi:hypothetical protein